MTKAEEFKKAYRDWLGMEPASPTFRLDIFNLADINESGYLGIRQVNRKFDINESGYLRIRQVRMNPADAMRFAKWIVKTFSDCED